jgi:hypothetical protein
MCRDNKILYNPLEIFKKSKTPAGIYARKRWLDESATAAWQNDFKETVATLMKGQSADGSWFQSPVETVRRLFGLHLTVRNRTEYVDKTLKWLIKESLNHHYSKALDEDLPSNAFWELPFIKAKGRLTLVCATLFLACVFQQDNHETIEEHYKYLTRLLDEHSENKDLWADKSNVLRALIVHPVYSNDPAALKLVDDLGENQQPSGIWPAPIPFFLTVNALAHLKSERAHHQWEKALPLLLVSQKKDGTWGNQDAQWNTFLVVHALKNKQCL